MICPICRKKAEAPEVDACEGYRLRECPLCGVVFSDPMKGPGAEWYEGSELYFMGHHVAPRLFWHHQNFLRRRPQGRSLLDVGCGEGAFLNAAKEAGYDAWGLDFDRLNIANAKARYGLHHIYPLSVEAFCRSKRTRFELVTFFEVLEHMEDPRVFLGQVRKLLKPGGRLVLSCPNRLRSLDALRGGDYPPNHLTRWDAGSLRMFVEANGFRVVRLEIKPFGSDEVVEFLRSRVKLGLARSMVRKSVASGDAAPMQKAKVLMGLKDALLVGFAVPAALLLKPFPLQGSGLYCEAIRNKIP